MKIIFAAALLVGAAAMIPASAMAACSTCTIQTKTPSKVKGKFDYKMSCIQDTSGDEIMSTVTAAKDDEAQQLAKKKCP